jgi:hypothetical protein
MQRSIALFTTLIATFAVSSIARTAHAQDADSQVWGLFTFNARFPNKFRLYAEVQPRLGENYNRYTQLLIRPAVGYQINRTFSAWLGYGWTPSFFPEFNGENRIFQQLLWEDGYQGTSITNRFRLEQRFIEYAGETAWRARHQLRLSRPVSKGSQWSYVGYDELFWHLNTTPRGPKAGFDQNRLFLGMSYNVSRHTRLELGYMPTFVNPRNGPDRRFDILMIGANYNL